MVGLNDEIKRRRTFAIISHPDAGKTTLTEKLLLFGGAIHVAGAVRSNKIRKTATSDFLEIEKQRGISVATSVMSFDYKGIKINILDTPGHKDFAEDTYRTLTAVDSVILVIDSVKGVEEQTRRLMEVCRMRATPVMIFINKMDREGKDPFDLLEELGEELHIAVTPFTWPAGMGSNFKGVYNIFKKNIQLYTPEKSNLSELLMETGDISDPMLKEYVGPEILRQLLEETELTTGLYETFQKNLYLEGYLAPVFFGSALNNTGVLELLETFIEIAPPPTPSESYERAVSPDETDFSGYIFKIHANLDPRHRNRMAFMRVCSGVFERNKMFYHTRLKRKMRFSSPAEFIANTRSTIDEAYPGDVIGLYDTGSLKIGDTLTEGEFLHFRGVPNFAPELLREVINRDPSKSKQLDKGVRQLTDEGLAQLFLQQPGNRKIIGTVGELQFDVIKFRLEHEYGALCDLQPLTYVKALWFTFDDPSELKEFSNRKASLIAYDKDNAPVFFAESEWMIKIMRDAYPSLRFHKAAESFRIS
ncbi:MAG: peptide chain release factor 3 [Bacteroidales bacterium]|nr:peptide chain release factor 3 [Bacteroidales bacterium]MDT8402209.1 peptide chain release factor 3 [Bacteroidales bacterium]